MQNYLYPFFNSSFFIALTTLLVGTAAYVVYRIQQRDRKREAANIILLEIQSAERILQLIKKGLAKDPPTLPPDLRLLPNESWSKNNYLFIKDFDRNEWDSLTDFYNKCMLLDETIRYNNASFWNDVEQIRSNKQRILADLSKESAEELTGTVQTPSVEDKDVIIKFNDLTEKFDEIYMSKQGRFGYTPQKTIDDAKLYIGEINLRLSQSNIGLKLKVLTGTKTSLEK